MSSGKNQEDEFEWRTKSRPDCEELEGAEIS